MLNLGKMNSVECAKVLCEAAEPLGRIMMDDKVASAIVGMKKSLGEKYSMIQLAGSALSHLAPVLLGDAHREDTFHVVAVMSGRDVEEIRNQPGPATISAIVEMLLSTTDFARFRGGDKAVRDGNGMRDDIQTRSTSDNEGVGIGAAGAGQK